MSNIDENQGRFIAVILNHKTGTHPLINRMPETYSECIARCQSLGTVKPSYHRLLFKCHNNNPVK